MPIVTVLDFNLGETHIYEYDNEVEIIEEVIQEKGHRLVDCQWLCTDSLILKIHTDKFVAVLGNEP